MDGDSGDGLRDPGSQGDDACDVGGVRRLRHAAENNLVNQSRINARAGQERTEGDTAQFVRAERGQLGARLAERRADAIHNHQSLSAHRIAPAHFCPPSRLEMFF